LTALKDENDNEYDLLSVINTNLVIGFLLCTKEAILSMRKYKVDGYIINVNSVFDHKVPIVPGIPPYHNLHGLTTTTDVLRQELVLLKSDKIRMTVI
jgi:NAD(P)-dependent dehydrogenase (short-subunit alcohol dehydrogenase family)